MQTQSELGHHRALLFRLFLPRRPPGVGLSPSPAAAKGVPRWPPATPPGSWNLRGHGRRTEPPGRTACPHPLRHGRPCRGTTGSRPPGDGKRAFGRAVKCVKVRGAQGTKMWISGGFKGAKRVCVECTECCPNEAARRAHWVPPTDFVARSGRRRRRRVVAAAAGRGGGAAALPRFPAFHMRQRLGADGINVSLLRGLRVLTVYMIVGADRYAPTGPPDGGGGSWRRRIGDPSQSVLS